MMFPAQMDAQRTSISPKLLPGAHIPVISMKEQNSENQIERPKVDTSENYLFLSCRSRKSFPDPDGYRCYTNDRGRSSRFIPTGGTESTLS